MEGNLTSQKGNINLKKSNLKEIINIIKQNVENEDVEMEIIDLPNNKIKHIIIGNKKTIQVKKQSSMTTKQFQEYVIQFISKQESFNQYVIEFIQEQKEFNKMVMQRLDKQEKFNQMILQKVDNIDQRLIKVENDIKDIKSCPTIQKELNSK